MMTATATATRTATFTITDARYVGAKVGADLRLLNILYGRPSLESIADFAEEAALLLRDRYLGTVDYGFRDTATNSWKLRLRYTATTGGHLLDDRPGTLPHRGGRRRVPLLQLPHLQRGLPRPHRGAAGRGP
jgi:Bacterial HORMA domain family 1